MVFLEGKGQGSDLIKFYEIMKELGKPTRHEDLFELIKCLHSEFIKWPSNRSR